MCTVSRTLRQVDCAGQTRPRPFGLKDNSRTVSQDELLLSQWPFVAIDNGLGTFEGPEDPNTKHEPHCQLFFAGVTAPFVVQPTASTKRSADNFMSFQIFRLLHKLLGFFPVYRDTIPLVVKNKLIVGEFRNERSDKFGGCECWWTCVFHLVCWFSHAAVSLVL